MAFSITFRDERLCYPYDDLSTPAASGLLVLGEFQEGFLASLYQWSREDYERQWRQAIAALLHGMKKSALMTEYLSPETASHLVWWPMYLVEDRVFFQNHLLFYNQLKEPFSIENALSFVRDRKTASFEGEKLSEWSVHLSEVETFALTL
jgi:hypothetical protein